jgi:hypothetical protein
MHTVPWSSLCLELHFSLHTTEEFDENIRSSYSKTAHHRRYPGSKGLYSICGVRPLPAIQCDHSSMYRRTKAERQMSFVQYLLRYDSLWNHIAFVTGNANFGD